jgi:predicted dehydrogenase
MKANIIGTGFGSRVVAKLFKIAGIDVVDVVSPRDSEAVKRACAAPVDFISIHSPPFMHRDHVMFALENKRNVVCDKPFGRSVGEAREMLAAAEAAGVIHLLNFEFRHEPARVKAKELIDQGAIGKPYHIQWNSMMAGSRAPLRPYNWLWNREQGGGWIGAFGSHAIDAMRWWTGAEVKTVSGICRTEIPKRPDKDGVEHVCTAEDSFTAAFTFTNGMSALLDTSYTLAVNRPYAVEIMGSEGVIAMNFGSECHLLRTDKNDQHFKFPEWVHDMHEPAMLPWAAAIQDAIKNKKQITPSFKDGVAAAEVMDNFRNNAVWVRQ